MSSALTGCFLAAKPDEPLEAAAEALAAFGVAAEDAAAGADGPGHVPRAALRRAVRARPGDARRAGAHRGAVRLDELGELGLLAELERLGLVAGDRARRGPDRRPRRDAGRARRGRALPLRPRRRGASSASAPRQRTSATSRRRVPNRSRSSSRSARRATRSSRTSSSSTRGWPRPACRCAAAIRRARGSVLLTRHGARARRARAGRAGARPGDLRRRDRAARRRRRGVSRRAGSRGRRSASRRARGSRASRQRCSTSPTGSRADAAHIARRSGCRVVHRARARPARRRRDARGRSASARTTSCSRRRRDPLGFTVIGRCEEGSGVG